jgi:hypothetical protein
VDPRTKEGREAIAEIDAKMPEAKGWHISTLKTRDGYTVIAGNSNGTTYSVTDAGAPPDEELLIEQFATKVAEESEAKRKERKG